MLTTIQELERQIDRFHQNIKDSNELMQILQSVAALTKTQTESFEAHSASLQSELAKLPPELGDLFESKTRGFLQEIHDEHQSYQRAVTDLMERYNQKIAATETTLARLPGEINAQLQKDRAQYEAMNRSINRKLTLVLGGVAAAIIVAVIALIL